MISNPILLWFVFFAILKAFDMIVEDFHGRQSAASKSDEYAQQNHHKLKMKS